MHSLPITQMKNKENITNQEKRKIIKVKNSYEKYGTLEKASNKLGISKERVRQILRKGQRLGLITYETTSNRNIKNLTQEITRKDILCRMEEGFSASEISSALSITKRELDLLKRHYEIEFKTNNEDAKKKRYSREYFQYVESLGHHPTSAELQETKKGTSLYNNIVKNWGGIERFRESHSIEKPKFRNTEVYRKSLRKNIEIKKARKMERLNKITEYIKKHGKLSPKEIREGLNLKTSTTTFDLKELLEMGKVKAEGQKRSRKYYST